MRKTCEELHRKKTDSDLVFFGGSVFFLCENAWRDSHAFPQATGGGKKLGALPMGAEIGGEHHGSDPIKL
jgi:hypothetical protein